jgi:alpha-beta hydrolase superfamily lysophospholipase
MRVRWLIWLTLALPCGAYAQAGIEPGSGTQAAVVDGKSLHVETYRPADCQPHLILLVFHGVARDADKYRDHARPVADRLCAVVVAPLFDHTRFPRDLYQYGGIADHGRLLAPGTRTVDLVEPLATWARGVLGSPQMPFILMGHSAGAQFLGRVTAFTASRAERIVLANPSTWVMPSTTTAIPFGFSGLQPPDSEEQALRLYLARPVIVALGRSDTGTAELDQSVEAKLQGATRYERGRNAFASAKATAEQHGWPFGWTLVEVDGVGHNATKMFMAAPLMEALQAAH